MISIGNVSITAIQDAPVLMNPRVFIPAHADQIAVEYADALDERQLFPISITSFLIRSEGKNVLVDTGLGGRKRAGFPPGKLDQALAAAGVAPGNIDLVVHTHLHIDHVGWNTVDNAAGQREIFFPRARFVVQQREWDHWMQPEHLENPGNAHLVECVQPLESSGRLDLVTAETPLDANLTFIAAPGHTPGHVAIGIYSAGERAVIIGDASHHPFQIDHPDWSPAFDTDPVLAARTRDRLFDEAAADGRTWIAGHWQFPGMGRIVRIEGRRVFQAL